MASATLRRRTSQKPSKRSPRAKSVRCNLFGPESGLAVGVASSINKAPDHSDAIAIGLGSRSHTSTCGNALAIGMGALAEISGEAFSACAFGHAPKAVSHNEAGIAIAVGVGPEAAALGESGVAVAISDGDGPLSSLLVPEADW